jgi:L-asparaginase
MTMEPKPRIAHLAGANATIQNSPPLVTSNKAREKYGLPLLTSADGSALRFDVLRPQRLAAPVTVYVEQFSAHPLERDAAELYGPPDGYLDSRGTFHKERRGADDTPVYEITLQPDDGVYPLPYMARQADGRAWEEDCAQPMAPELQARQPFYPDGSRLFEEIDRLGVGEKGIGNLISARADIDFYRVVPSSGYTKGLGARLRTDVGEGDIAPEVRGRDFFPYRPYHLGPAPPRPALARIANAVQRILATGRYVGAVWTQGSPRIEEAIYWLNLLVDTTLPICGNASQRPHGQVSNDGDKNIVDSVEYIVSRVWADEAGRNRAGVVLVQDQQVFAARDVQKADARPGGYVAAGGHGGILGAAGWDGPAVLNYVPATLHTYLSAVNITRLPAQVIGHSKSGDTRVAIKDARGGLLESAIPKVTIVKDGNYTTDDYDDDPSREVDLLAQIERNLAAHPLAGFVVEGLSPYGRLTSLVRTRVMRRAAFSGMPVVLTGRGNAEGFVPPPPAPFIGGRNLTSTKARLLLMACLMKLGTLPAARDPDRPTPGEVEAVQRKIREYQDVFDTH